MLKGCCSWTRGLGVLAMLAVLGMVMGCGCCGGEASKPAPEQTAVSASAGSADQLQSTGNCCEAEAGDCEKCPNCSKDEKK
jgi:hypothetical protein